jgi:hypothetical protein
VTWTRPGEVMNKKAKLLYQKILMKDERGFFLDEMAFADLIPLFEDAPVDVTKYYKYHSPCDSGSESDLDTNQDSLRSVLEQISNGMLVRTSDPRNSYKRQDETQGAKERREADDQDLNKRRMSDRHSRRIRSTIFNSIVFPWCENSRCCTLAGALDFIVFQRVAIRYLRRAWSGREDIVDDRCARNRIQTSSWVDSSEQREFLRSQIGRWYARRHKEWKGVLIEKYRARKGKSCSICGETVHLSEMDAESGAL